MSFGNYLENKVLDKILKNTDFTVAPVYVSLHTADPGETGASELAGGSYARQQVAAAGWDAGASGATQNNGIVDFTGMPICTITHGGLWDAPTGGNFLWGGALAASKSIANAGDTFEFPIGDIDASVD